METIFYREIIDSELLSVLNLPEELKHTKVEVIVLPCEEKQEKNNIIKNISGIWQDTNINLDIIREKAW